MRRCAFEMPSRELLGGSYSPEPARQTKSAGDRPATASGVATEQLRDGRGFRQLALSHPHQGAAAKSEGVAATFGRSWFIIFDDANR